MAAPVAAEDAEVGYTFREKLLSTSVLLIEDDPLVCAAARAVLVRDDAHRLVVCHTLSDARRTLISQPVSVAIVDLSLPDGAGLSLLPLLREQRVLPLVLTARADERTAYEAIVAGAVGYLVKPDGVAALPQAIADALAGGSPVSPKIARWLIDDVRSRRAPVEPEPLTDREREVLELFAAGATYAEVASALHIGVNTVRTHVRHVYEKLQVSTKTEAVLRGLGSRR
jgi:DNA-binding NarL/FixJ family response regulator